MTSQILATVQKAIDFTLKGHARPFYDARAEMKGDCTMTLQRVAEVLSKYPATGLLIRCYLDDEMPAGEAVVLSKARGAAVRKFLTDRGILNTMRYAGMGFADTLGARMELLILKPNCPEMLLLLARSSVSSFGPAVVS